MATAASITGWVRAYLFRALRACERPLYCDTDSIACARGVGLDLGPDLGQWKDEGHYYRAAIAGRKMYAFFGRDEKGAPAEKTASKGVTLSADQIASIAAGQSVTARRDAPNFSVRFGRRYIEREIKAT